MKCNMCGKPFENYASDSDTCSECIRGCNTCDNVLKYFSEYPCNMCVIQCDKLGSMHTSRPNPCILPESALA